MSLSTIASTLALFALGLAGIVHGVISQSPAIVLAASGAVGLVLVVSGIVRRRRHMSRGASISRIESSTAASMGLIWLWGAIAIVTVYPLMMYWREWPHFSGAFLAAGLLSLGYARLVSRDADAGRDDPTLLQLGRYLAWAQFAGMIITLIGLGIDPDKEIVYIKETDWAGNGIFVTGAAALLLMTAEALFLSRQTLPAPQST